MGTHSSTSSQPVLTMNSLAATLLSLPLLTISAARTTPPKSEGGSLDKSEETEDMETSPSYHHYGHHYGHYGHGHHHGYYHGGDHYGGHHHGYGGHHYGHGHYGGYGGHYGGYGGHYGGYGGHGGYGGYGGYGGHHYY